MLSGVAIAQLRISSASIRHGPIPRRAMRVHGRPDRLSVESARMQRAGLHRRLQEHLRPRVRLVDVRLLLQDHGNDAGSALVADTM